MTVSFTRDQVLALEYAAARAWPPERMVEVDGWRVRLSGGGSRRANSVLTLGYMGSSFDASIARTETLYREQKTRSYFHVSTISKPSDLDARLAERGYVYEEPCLLMAKPLAPRAMPAGVKSSDAPTADWLATYTEQLDATRKAAAPSILAGVPKPRKFLLVERDDQPLSSALAVLSPDGVVIVECVATRAGARRSGGASTVMDALESWAASNGAHTAALQVVAENTPAITLYQRRGYVDAARYHYRWSDVA